MDKWIGIASQWGIGGVILLALGAFIYFKLWPALEKWMAQAQAAREKEIDKFAMALDKKDVLLERIVDKQNAALQSFSASMTGEFINLRNEVREAVKRRDNL